MEDLYEPVGLLKHPMMFFYLPGYLTVETLVNSFMSFLSQV